MWYSIQLIIAWLHLLWPLGAGMTSVRDGFAIGGNEPAAYTPEMLAPAPAAAFQTMEQAVVPFPRSRSATPFNWVWSRVDATGNRPAAREGHAAVEIGTNIFFFGGCVQGIRCFSDVHIFDTNALSWSQEPFTGDAPEPRGGHSAVLIGTDVFVFGGANSETTFGDAYKLDLVQRHWARAVPADCPAVPSRRTNHAAVADAHGRIYIMGGYDADSNFLNDMWILNVYAANSNGWQDGNTFPVVWERPSVTGSLPLAREGHSLTLVDRKMILFGGYAANGKVMNDVHVFNPDSQEWAEVEVAGAVVPAPRQAHSAARHGRDVIIAGGCDVSDLHPECFNDVWSLDTVGMRWSRKPLDEAAWFPREGHSASFVRGMMFTFGGCQLNSECYNDVTALNTADACPSDCGGHGMCMQNAFCRCEPGFTSHDCMQPLTCPRDCSGHGHCSESGVCACDNGWGGDDCSVEYACPGSPSKCFGHGKCLYDGRCQCFNGYTESDCSGGSALCPRDCLGRGYCNPKSQCVCNKGFTGPACETSVFSFQAQHNNTASNNSRKHLGLLATAKHAASYAPHDQSKKKVVATGASFGIPELNPVGHAGVQESDCTDNCNFRGVCSDGTCYCQPGYYGKTCKMVKTSEKGTVSLAMLLIIGGACAAVSFTVMSLLLHLSLLSKRAKETEIGYNV